jgi:hypothetical protein
MILFSSINPDLSLSLLRIHGSIDVRKRCWFFPFINTLDDVL